MIPVSFDALIAHAMRNIQLSSEDEEIRVDQAERAEKTLQPVVAALAGDASMNADRFPHGVMVREFPWTFPV
ncbi:hypothetical protein Q5Y75_17025 [Ruegeria sp. 2205SS24-7]|uniref:hypothetical protein n=1 Tax=Ruegeria discodermiae TaxID=3064389 RepID=UPI002740E619|nr:hypothetical protein [Ruegeria sp. 2205SS24-7]MDP5218926.1 hypothetical protein [Ruegeria sp. 2205SS24-7]